MNRCGELYGFFTWGKGARTQGVEDSRGQGFKDARIQGFKGSRGQGVESLFSNDLINALSILSTSLISSKITFNRSFSTTTPTILRPRSTF